MSFAECSCQNRDKVLLFLPNDGQEFDIFDIDSNFDESLLAIRNIDKRVLSQRAESGVVRKDDLKYIDIDIIPVLRWRCVSHLFYKECLKWVSRELKTLYRKHEVVQKE